MSITLSLSRGYGSFFWGCTKFAASPYTSTFMAIASSGNRDEEILENVTAAAVVCGILTFVIPVLPVLTSITVALASVAMLLAVASMFVTYPFAILADACNPSESSWEEELFKPSLS